LWSIVLLILCYAIAVKVYADGRTLTVTVAEGESSGVVWKDGKEVGAVHLVAVKKGSAGEKLGLKQFEGHRILQINGDPVETVDHAHQLEISKSTMIATEAGGRKKVVFLFKSYQTVIDALIEFMGETPALFLSNGLNNMFWWAIGDGTVMEAWAQPDDYNSHGVNVGGYIKTFFLASALTVLCVVVFHFNNVRWETWLAEQGGKTESKDKWAWQHAAEKKKKSKRASMGNPQLKDALLQEHDGFVYKEDKSSAGPHMPVMHTLHKAHAVAHGVEEDENYNMDLLQLLMGTEERLQNAVNLSKRLLDKQPV